MFPWPTLALGTHSRFRGNGLLGYSQTLTDHHFVMAARFCETLPLAPCEPSEKQKDGAGHQVVF
jgi:hypothetical protein